MLKDVHAYMHTCAHAHMFVNYYELRMLIIMNIYTTCIDYVCVKYSEFRMFVIMNNYITGIWSHACMDMCLNYYERMLYKHYVYVYVPHS